MTTTHYGDMEMIRRNSVEKGDESDEDGYTTSPSKSYGDGLHHDDNETERVPFILHQGAYSPTSSSFDKYPEGSNGQMMRERQLVKKLDYLIMPIAIILYLGAYLDRGNLGNANALGLTKDILQGSDEQYAWVASIFYFAYILFQIPGTSGPKLIPANLWIGGVAVVWGTAAASQAVIQSYKGIMIARFILGMGEAGFGAAIPLIFSFWYTKREIGFRLSIFIGSAAAAGVFGGLLAYCIKNINSTGIESWRVLFFVESVPVILAGFFCCFILPDRPATTRWLNEDERQLALSRLAREASQEVHGSSLNWRHAVMAISDRRLAMCYAIYMGVNIALASLGNFLPAIVAGMGYTGASAQIMTVPPYSVAFVVMTFVNYTSDRSGRRGLFVAFFMMIGALGYLILLFVHHNDHIRYSAIFLVTSGTYTTIPLMLSWVTANAGSETQKVIGLAGLNTFGQTFAILAAHVYPKSAAPYYTLGYGLSCGSQLIASILALALVRTWGQENSRRDRVYGKPPSDAIVNTAEFGDRAPNFRYML